MHHSALEILSKYNNEIPKLKTIHYYNRGIKIICQKAGITQQVTREYRKGGKIITETVEKYTLVSSHTGRRTAITNLYLENVDLVTLMKFSGHASIESLLLYIKASSADHLKVLSKTTYFQNNLTLPSTYNVYYNRKLRHIVKTIRRQTS